MVELLRESRPVLTISASRDTLRERVMNFNADNSIQTLALPLSLKGLMTRFTEFTAGWFTRHPFPKHKKTARCFTGLHTEAVMNQAKGGIRAPGWYSIQHSGLRPGRMAGSRESNKLSLRLI